MNLSNASIPEIIQQGGLVLSYGYVAYLLWKDNKKKEGEIKDLNQKVLDAFISQIQVQEQTKDALDKLRQVIEEKLK